MRKKAWGQTGAGVESGMPSDQPDNPPGPPQGPRKRRPRYPGKYPRRFEHRYKELAPEAHPEIHAHVRAQGRTPAGTHVPVLVAEVMDALHPAAGETVIDCTVGYGGHALEFLSRIRPTGRLLGFDVDAENLERTRKRLEAAAGGAAILLRRGNFAGIDRAMAAEHMDAANIIFADLGVSSMQVDDPARGFSYKFDGPLDMRMDSRLPRSAADLLRDLAPEKLAAALADLADEPDAALIAARIAEERRQCPLARTLDLVRLIFDVKHLSQRRWREQQRGPAGQGDSREASDLHPAARTFQALRILVNDELGALRQLLRVAPACLAPGGRIGIISFHSGEDRLVKLAFRDGMRAGVLEAISDEPIRPTPQEVRDNPRSASAKFRWAVKAL